MNTTTRSRSGFTLIELLTVIAIIGILAAVLFPGVQAVMKSAKRSAASTKLSNIAKAYVNFSNSGSGGSRVISDAGAWTITTPTQAKSISDYAAVLAKTVDLNDAELWYVDADTQNESVATFPKQVLVNNAIEAKMVGGSKTNGYISWAAYTPTTRNISSTTPIVWTRGLDSSSGAWGEKAVWGTEGGHIGFGDGHITWYDNTTDAFVDKTSATGGTTSDWKKSISKSWTGELLEHAP